MRVWLDRLKTWARAIRRDAVALYLATRDPRVPWCAKVLAAVIAAYALPNRPHSRLIPVLGYLDSVLGYLDEVILLPLAMAGVMRLIDPAIMVEHRAAAARIAARPVSRSGAALILAVWVGAAALLVWQFWPR